MDSYFREKIIRQDSRDYKDIDRLMSSRQPYGISLEGRHQSNSIAFGEDRKLIFKMHLFHIVFGGMRIEFAHFHLENEKLITKILNVPAESPPLVWRINPACPACPVEFTCDSAAYSSGVALENESGVALAEGFG